MKKIKVAYVDFWKNFIPEEFIFHKNLKKIYDVEITKDNPDFVFCSWFGNEFLKYKCPRILFLGEAICPDFNLYDYAIGFDDIHFGDRYLRYPLFLTDKKMLESALHKHERSEEYYLNKKKFCCFVVSSGGGVDDVRNHFFEELCEYKKVDSGGRFKNNLPDGQPVKDKIEFQEDYRFCIAFENTKFPGYVTEKIIEAWASGTIPIYYGDPEIGKIFNTKAMIYCDGKEDFKNVIEQIEKIDSNDEKYLEMVKQPILENNHDIEKMMQEEYLLQFLKNIFDQNPKDAYRRNSESTMWGICYENDLKRRIMLDENAVTNFFRKTKRKFFGNKNLIKRK